jgi:hypothetical protein
MVSRHSAPVGYTPGIPDVGRIMRHQLQTSFGLKLLEVLSHSSIPFVDQFEMSAG